ncbi:TPA: hypothetical protein IAD52_03875 [Candidatus Spyradomonas excrementavium]|nr:hypothetical protein [Candidatus Spyradomonas excrementavium]
MRIAAIFSPYNRSSSIKAAPQNASAPQNPAFKGVPGFGLPVLSVNIQRKLDRFEKHEKPLESVLEMIYDVFKKDPKTQKTAEYAKALCAKIPFGLKNSFQKDIEHVEKMDKRQTAYLYAEQAMYNKIDRINKDLYNYYCDTKLEIQGFIKRNNFLDLSFPEKPYEKELSEAKRHGSFEEYILVLAQHRDEITRDMLNKI